MVNIGAFLKTQRHLIIRRFDTDLHRFMSVIKTHICRTPPPRFANLCPYISLTYLFISLLNVPMLVTGKSRTPPPHASTTVAAAAVAEEACRGNNSETMVAMHEGQ
jgi:hypothetical protein